MRLDAGRLRRVPRAQGLSGAPQPFRAWSSVAPIIPGAAPGVLQVSGAGISGGCGALPTAGTVLLAVLLGAAPVAGQGNLGGASRTELQTMVDMAAAGSIRLRQREYDEIQRRLTQGDFSIGDQISLTVAGEPTLTKSFQVEPGPSLRLPDIPAISLYGVLRSEIETHLRTELSRYLRNPDVKATSLMRIAMFGAVGNPGFYYLSPNVSLSDAIMSAGGPAGTADMGKIVIRRGDQKIYEKQEVTMALTAGTTLDRMNLQGGDAVDIGTTSPLIGKVGRVLLAVGALAGSILAINRLLSR